MNDEERRLFWQKSVWKPKMWGFYLRLVVRLERWGTFLVAGKQYEVHRCDIFLITSTFLLFFTLIHQLMCNLDIHAFFRSSSFLTTFNLPNGGDRGWTRNLWNMWTTIWPLFVKQAETTFCSLQFLLCIFAPRHFLLSFTLLDIHYKRYCSLTKDNDTSWGPHIHPIPLLCAVSKESTSVTINMYDAVNNL